MVEEVSVEPHNATAILVSWKRLDSEDVVAYRVIYTLEGGASQRQSGGSAAGSLVFPGNASSGVVGGLRPQLAYQFQVVAVVTLPDGSTADGPASVPVVNSSQSPGERQLAL